VSVLGYYLEAAGLPTTQISLVREHSVMIRPPRALWVSFELGRPFGVPNDAPFQTRVIEAALDLLARTDGPVLEDYPEDVPVQTTAVEEDGWACPISLPAPPKPVDQDADILDEIEFLRSWHDLAADRRGSPTHQSSRVDIKDAARHLAAWARGETPDSPVEGFSHIDMLRLCSEDLKAYYAEAATAQPAHNGQDASSNSVSDWFWGDTQGGNLLLQLAEVCRQSDDKLVKITGNGLIVPYHQRHRRSVPHEAT
jgi:hypothetical protein